MFKVNNKDTRTMPLASGLEILHRAEDLVKVAYSLCKGYLKIRPKCAPSLTHKNNKQTY